MEEVYPDKYTGPFHLIDSFYTATPIISSTITTSHLPKINKIVEGHTTNLIISTTNISAIDNIHRQESVTRKNLTPKTSYRIPFEWLYKKLRFIGVRGLVITSVLSICLLALLLLLIIYLYCKTRRSKQEFSCQYKQTTGNKKYSPINRYSRTPSDNRYSKKYVPNCLRYLHKNQSKSLSFHLTSNGHVSRLNSGDSYRLLSSRQENQNDKRSSSYKTSDCISHERCCVYSSSLPPTSSLSLYHQADRIMSSVNETSLSLTNHTQYRPSSNSTTLCSVRKNIDNSSAQTYSAVYSCELAANLDIDSQIFPRRRSPTKRRSTLNTYSSHVIQNQILFLYMKNLVDCYAFQSNGRQKPLLAMADENRIQLLHVQVSYLSDRSYQN